jgi:MFS family permease
MSSEDKANVHPRTGGDSMENEEYQVYGYRWVVTAVFGLILCIQNFLWLSFAPIESSVQKALGMGVTPIRLLALVGPFMFIVASSYAGSLSDNRGWKFSVGAGVIMMVVAGVVKAITPHVISSGTSQYWVYLFMQILGGTGSAFALANLSKMPIKWFAEKQRALGNGLTTMTVYLGTAIGLPLVTAIASIPKTATVAAAQAGLNRVLTVVGIITVTSAALFFIFAKENPPTPSGPVPDEKLIPLRESFPFLLRLSVFRALCIVSLAGYGIYIGMTVTMEKIMGFHGFSTNFASYVAAGITIGGIIGAGILPVVSEKVGLRKPFLILAGAVAIPGVLIIAFIGSRFVDLSVALVMGFCLLPALPITFTMVGEMKEIGPKLAATAVGTLLAVGSIGSAFIPLLMEAFARKQPGNIIDYRWAILFLAALGVAALLAVVFAVKETGPRRMNLEGKPPVESASAG